MITKYLLIIGAAFFVVSALLSKFSLAQTATPSPTGPSPTGAPATGFGWK